MILGARLNNEAFSAYSEEAEVLLTDGIGANILDVVHDVQIDNPHQNFNTNDPLQNIVPFNGKSMSVVFLYLP